MVTAVAIAADCSWDEYFLGQFGYLFGPAAVGAAFMFAFRAPQEIVAGFFLGMLGFLIGLSLWGKADPALGRNGLIWFLYLLGAPVGVGGAWVIWIGTRKLRLARWARVAAATTGTAFGMLLGSLLASLWMRGA